MGEAGQHPRAVRGFARALDLEQQRPARHALGFAEQRRERGNIKAGEVPVQRARDIERDGQPGFLAAIVVDEQQDIADAARKLWRGPFAFPGAGRVGLQAHGPGGRVTAGIGIAGRTVDDVRGKAVVLGEDGERAGHRADSVLRTRASVASPG